jgi:hypothetical protein
MGSSSLWVADETPRQRGGYQQSTDLKARQPGVRVVLNQEHWGDTPAAAFCRKRA